MVTFRERLNQALGPRGYDISLRRSLQSVVLFEAKRCVAEFEARRTAQHLPPLRVFQRKAIHWETAKNLLASTDLQPYQCVEVTWRTCTGKEPLGDDTSWKRVKIIEKELSKLADQIRPYQTDGLSSDEAVDIYVQGLCKAAIGSTEKPNEFIRWGYTHNNCILCYKMYYKNCELDPSLPPARSPKPIEIPIRRFERAGVQPLPARVAHVSIPVEASVQEKATTAEASRASIPVEASVQETAPLKEDDVNVADLEAAVAQDSKLTVEERRGVLHEVRQHLELLKEFEDVVPEEELKKRKRELFLALPNAPPPFERKARFTGE